MLEILHLCAYSMRGHKSDGRVRAVGSTGSMPAERLLHVVVRSKCLHLGTKCIFVSDTCRQCSSSCSFCGTVRIPPQAGVSWQQQQLPAQSSQSAQLQQSGGGGQWTPSQSGSGVWQPQSQHQWNAASQQQWANSNNGRASSCNGARCCNIKRQCLLAIRTHEALT